MARRPRRSPSPNESSPPPPKPWEEAGDGAGSFGSWLRQQREIRNISLREIADSTKIGMRYLEALEDDRFDLLPAPVFTRGFLREYARYVGLDADEVVNSYLLADREAGRETHEPELALDVDPMVEARERRARFRKVAAVVVIVVLALLVVVAVRRSGDGGAGRATPAPVSVPPESAPAEAVAAVPAEPEAPTPADGIVVTLTFTADCWVEAEVDGQQQVSELKVQGESLRLEGERRVVLETLGNAGAVRVEVNGRPFDIGGGSGQVVNNLVIDRQAAGLPPLPNGPGPRGGAPGASP